MPPSPAPSPRVCAALALALLLPACRPEAVPPPAAPPGPTAPAGPWLTEATAEAGLEFRHDSGATGRLQFGEIMGAGAALFDCDGDGDLDLLLRQGGALEDGAGRGPGRTTDRLMRNDLAPGPGGRPRVRFVDVTAGSGVDRPVYGMGVAAGDFDDDGHVDLYLTALGPARLLRGLGGCRFEEVTAAAGVEDSRWTVPATFFDFDRDGRLDLYVGRYVEYTPGREKTCYRADSAPDYCGPKNYPPLPDRLLRNLGGGRFADVSEAAGVAAAAPGRALGAVAFDADADGWPDLFVGNDATDNHLLRNRGDGTFAEEGIARGVAVNASGQRTGDMGVAAEDLDGDGDFDLLSTHIAEEGIGAWTNDGAGWFWENAAQAGLLAVTLGDTGFGIGTLDLDHDGALDLYLANGAVNAIERLSVAGDPQPLHQPNRLLRNVGNGRFGDLTGAAGAALSPSEVSRGVAQGDIDDDGDVDLVVTNNGGPARLLLSHASERGPWLGLRLVTGPGGRDALGAEAALGCAGGRRLVRRVHTDGSFASASDPRIVFGLTGCPEPRTLEVRWPDGRRERFAPPQRGVYRTLRAGDGESVD